MKLSSRTPLSVLIGALALTALTSISVHLSSRARDEARFENAVQATDDRLTSRLEAYVAALRGVQGLFAASRDVTREDFRAFVKGLDLPRNFPGVQGIGFSRRLTPDEAAATNVWPKGPRDEYHAIVFLEPDDRRNAAALGFDMFSEPVRREAMERARDTGEPALSGRVTLVQEIEGPTQPGFLIYLPVYEGGRTPPTVEARRELLKGFIYSPFRAGDLFSRLFGTESQPRVGVAIYDGAETPGRLLRQDPAQIGRAVSSATWEAREALVLYGRQWHLVVRSLPVFDAGPTRWLPLGIALVGLALSAVLYGIVSSQAKARRNADVQRQTAETLSRLGLVFGSELDPEALVQRVTDEATRLTGAAFGAFFHNLPNEEGRYALYTLSGAPRSAFDWMPPVRTTSLFGHTFLGKGTLRLDDVHHSPLYGKNPPYHGMPEGHLPVKSYLAVAVRSRSGEVLGGLFFGHPEAGRFEPAHEHLVEGLAAQAAVALDNARLYREAQEAIRVRDEFLSIASHEMKTPLTPLALRLDLLSARLQGAGAADSPSLEPARESVSTARRQVQRLSRLVDDLLDVSRITSGRLTLHRGEVDLAALVREAVARLEPQASRAGTTFAVQAPASLSGHWDQARIEQVVANLLDNALKYAPGTQVEVEVSSRDGKALLKVTDHGIGIDPGHLPHVFERFERAVSDRHYGGLGLGLYIARQIVDAHGGTITAQSTPNVETTFQVELPRS